MDRRVFLKKNLSGAFAAAFLVNWGTIDQIRQYIQDDKPLLTEKNLNRFFAKASRKGDLSTHLNHANENTLEFLENNFSLSPMQQKTVKGFTTEDLQQLKELIKTALDEGKVPTFNFGIKRAEQCQKTKITLPALDGIKTVMI